jgi:phage tail sheath gpL-like
MTFEQIPNSLLNPLFYAEVGDPKGAGAVTRTTAIIGQRISGYGTAVNDTAYQVFSPDDVAVLAGSGSIAHRLAMAYWSTDKTPQKVIVVPVADLGGAVKASKTLTLSFSSGVTLTASGTIHMLIGGIKLRVPVAAGQSLTDIADAIELALGTDEAAAAAIGSIYPVTMTNTAGAMLFTARNAGVLGNDIRILTSYLGTAGGEALPGNLLIDDYDAYLASGAGVPDITAALTALSPYPIFGLIEPHYTADELTEKKNEFADRWGYDVSTFGGHFAGVCLGTLGDIVGSGKIDDNLKNDWHGVVAAFPRAPFCSVEFGAAYAGACLRSLRNDPSLPVQGVSLPYMYAVRDNDRLTISDLETLAAAGFATASCDTTGTPIVSLERTTMLTNSLGAPITGGQACQYAYTTAYIVEEMRTFVQTEYARCKLVDDGARIAEGVAAVAPLEVKAALGALADGWEERAIIESAAQFRAGLVVERDTLNRNRLNVSISPDLANQLRVFAMRMVPVV